VCAATQTDRLSVRLRDTKRTISIRRTNLRKVDATTSITSSRPPDSVPKEVALLAGEMIERKYTDQLCGSPTKDISKIRVQA
jgi:hypothetical protein